MLKNPLSPRLQNNMAARWPIFGMACRNTSMLNDCLLRVAVVALGGSAMVFADRLFGLVIIALGLLSSALIVIAMI